MNVINELIQEYENKELFAIGDLATNIAGETVAGILTKHPALPLAKMASGIAMELTAIDEKAEWIALSCYRDALGKCIYAIDELYLKGVVPADVDELKQFVSMYLSILLKSNDLALNIALYQSNEECVVDTARLYDNIDLLNDMINTYF